MFGKQPGSSIVGIATLAISMVVFAACGNGAQSDAPPVDATATAVRATVAAAATAGIVPDGLVIATSTPDLDTANRLRPSDLRERLAQYRGIAAIFRAIDAHDAAALLAAFNWQDEGCGGRGTEACPVGVNPGTQYPMIRAGTDWMVTADTLRPAAEALVDAGAASTLSLVAQSQEQPAHYVFAYDLNHVTLVPPTGDNAIAVGGMVLDVDASSAHPVRALELTSRYPAALESAMERVRSSQGDLVPLLVVQR